MDIQIDVKRVNWLQAMLFNEFRCLSNEDRDLDIEWNVMHMYSSAQLSKLLALKRGIDPILASVTAILHDIAVVETKKRDNHAEIAEPYVRGAIIRYNNGPGMEVGKITDEETKIIIQAIAKHSDKEDYSKDPLAELLKDVDSIDRYFHGIKTEGAYMDRCKKVFKELGLGEV